MKFFIYLFFMLYLSSEHSKFLLQKGFTAVDARSVDIVVETIPQDGHQEALAEMQRIDAMHQDDEVSFKNFRTQAEPLIYKVYEIRQKLQKLREEIIDGKKEYDDKFSGFDEGFGTELHEETLDSFNNHMLIVQKKMSEYKSFIHQRDDIKKQLKELFKVYRDSAEFDILEGLMNGLRSVPE